MNSNIIDAGDLRKYRTEIPNIIDDMDLSVYAFRLYVHIKRVAGANGGECWQSTRTMADTCKMSVGAVSKAKQDLMDAGLIVVTHREKEKGETDIITIVDIWQKNFAAFSTSEPVHVVNTPVHGVNTPVHVVNKRSNPSKNKPKEEEKLAAAPPPPPSSLKETWLELQPGNHVNHAKAGKQLKELVKAGVTPEYLRELDTWLRTDAFWTDQTIYPASYYSKMDEYDSFKQRLAATGGVDPASPKLRANRTQFDNFSDYSQWAVVHDPDKKLLHEGVTIGGQLIRRNGKYLPTKGKNNERQFTNIVRDTAANLGGGVRQRM
jgi:hypothetical protein